MHQTSNPDPIAFLVRVFLIVTANKSVNSDLKPPSPEELTDDSKLCIHIRLIADA